jgi:alkaline phosphatase
MKFARIIIVLLIVSFNFYQCTPDKPKNIIIMISDGCGYNHIDATSLYEYGQTGLQVYEHFPVKYGMSTFSLDFPHYDPDSIWSTFDYTSDYTKRKPTDSAASATAMACGVKTLNKMIGMDTSGVAHENVLKRLEKYGKSSGVVTSVPLSHATPAGFSVHNETRKNYKEIALSMIRESSLDVIMGCGHPFYNNDGQMAKDTIFKYVGGETTWNRLLEGTIGNDANGDGAEDFWAMINRREDFQNMQQGETPDRVIGVPLIRSTLQKSRSGDTLAAPLVVPFNENVPTLVEMSRAAINVLDNNPDGFILLIEGGAIDWAAHDNWSGRMIEEEMNFNRAVESVVEWVEQNSSWDETLLIVTADHETGYITGPGSNDSTLTESATIEDIWKPLVNKGKGNLPGMHWNSTKHTNSLVPFFANGSGSERFDQYKSGVDPVRGEYFDNTSIAKVIFSLYPDK